MNSDNTPKLSNLEMEPNLHDYGDSQLNGIYKNLDEETKQKINKYPEKEIQIQILKNFANPELTELWNKLNDAQKQKINTIGLKDRFVLLKQLLKKQKDKEEEKKALKQQIMPEKPEMPEIPPKREAVLNQAPEVPPKNIETFQEQEELVEIEDLKDPLEKKKQHVSPQKRFDDLIKLFYDQRPYYHSIHSNINHELEVKFGTKGIKPINRNDYDNVIKKLKSLGFTLSGASEGQYYLRMNPEFLDSYSGKFKVSDIRTEIKGLHAIQDYCKSNDIKSIMTSNPTAVQFIKKKPPIINGEKVYPVDFDDFNFRVSYQTEEKVKKGVEMSIINDWRGSKKEFRFINRVTFEHPDYPVLIDISIVKFANKAADRYGRENRGRIIPTDTLEKSNVFNNPETYDIEIEINNSKIGSSDAFNNPALIVDALRKVIKFVLCGFQGTNFPVSYPEQKNIITSYMKMIMRDEYDPKEYITSKYFIGPNSITLQLKNITPIDENSNEPNIRKDFVVTDKADGDRHLMFVSGEGKIYLINTNMDVIFTGAKTNQEDCFNCLLDGELITHDKNGKFINLYAAFDVYYYKGQDVRNLTFLLMDKEEEIYKSRYNLLNYLIGMLKPVSIMNMGEPKEKSVKTLLQKYKNRSEVISPIKIKAKEFFPINKKQTIFEGCNSILQKERQGLFEYNTDGLIFTHTTYGVGSNEMSKAGPKTKKTWEYSFKWKPPQYNTIDFLVTTLKQVNGEDVIQSLYTDGINNNEAQQYSEYKTIELRCGFDESRDGFINPCQYVIDEKIVEKSSSNNYLPKRFYPTEPYDPNAGICNILLRMDGSGGKKMFSEENEVFEDNTIVEFRYDLDKESGWNWIPLRVRYDKTAKMRRGEKEFGNSYKVCNDNWKSIHPSGRIDEEMICTGLNIPTSIVSSDIYYNTTTGSFKTQFMKDFHNLYVKKMLIVKIAKQGDTLIDYACGKAGDLPKWVAAKLSFVFGIDLSKDNLENRIDGACARFLKMKSSNRNMPYALFVNGNSGFNIKDGSAMLNEKAKQITASVFATNTKEFAENIGKGVARQYGKGVNGFNISSCQFAIHYFFQTPDTLKQFMKNVAECTAINGYFIGTCYDGKEVFKKLTRTKPGDSIQIVEDGKKIWEITKGYNSDTFNDDSGSIGYRIDVYQESINQKITEYLVNFDYLCRLMTNFGFALLSNEECKEMGLPSSSGLFSELFLNMLDEISKNKFKEKDYANAPFMNASEKTISFLNRYFVFKKIRNVDIDSVEIDLSDYQNNEIDIDAEETKTAQKVAMQEEERPIKPKVRKLSKKMLLVPATEAVDEQPPTENPILEKKPKRQKKQPSNAKQQPKKLLVVESDSDEN